MAVRTGGKNRNAGRVAFSYTVYGNTVRVSEPYEREASGRSRKTGQRKQKERLREPQAVPYAVKKARLSLPTVLMLFLALAAVIYIVYNYLYLSASIDTHMDRVEAMEMELEALRTENDALEQSIDTSVDLNYVYDVAVNELGMVHAGESNTIKYDKTESEYVRQYESITK